jgi:hypothetical protein
MNLYKIQINRLSGFSVFILAILMLCSVNPWFAWHNQMFFVSFFSLLFLLSRLPLIQPKINHENIVPIIIAIIFFFIVKLIYIQSIVSIANYVRCILVFAFVILMQYKEQYRIITTITNIYSLIAGISIIYYFAILFFDAKLPYSIIEYPNEIIQYPKFRNYIFLLVPDNYKLFFRFQSIFTEPGHLGMISSLLLYVNKYNLKNIRCCIILLSIILSFSLAAYTLLFIGYIIYQFVSDKKLRSKFLPVVVLLITISLTVVYIYNKYSDSMVSVLIINRLEYDDSKGIVGNNRTDDFFDYYYENSFLKDRFLLGIGTERFHEKYGRGNSSYKTFIVQYGVLGILFVFLLYLSITYFSLSKLAVGLFILYCVSFWQRPYALWDMELFLFISAIKVFRTVNKLI